MNEIEIAEWNHWFQKYVLPVFDFNHRDEYYEKLKIIQPPFYPKFWIAEKFYEKIKNDSRFDEELKLFFAFLYSCGFFMEFIISFEEWISMPNWINPANPSIIEESILLTLNQPNGLKYLKSRLRWLPYINRVDGN